MSDEKPWTKHVWKLADGPRHPDDNKAFKREYLGQWIDEAQHFDNDTIRAIAYGADRMWRMGHSALYEYREIARGRWPTLRRVLGRNVPR